MGTDNIQVSITMSMPYGSPDKNGVSYEVIQNALSSMTSKLPIKGYLNNGDPIVIGHTTCTPYAIQNNKEENIVKFTVDGVIYSGCTECFVNKRNGNKTITDFEIVSFGFSE